MANIRGFELPEDRYYLVDKHVWALPVAGKAVRVGMTSVAYRLLRNSLVAITVSDKVRGSVVEKGKRVAMVESLKYIGPMPAPFTGTVLAVNERVLATPELAEGDPYGEGWIVEMAPSGGAAALAELPAGEVAMAAYRALIEAQNITLE